jgi:hypothetical protein
MPLMHYQFITLICDIACVDGCLFHDTSDIAADGCVPSCAELTLRDVMHQPPSQRRLSLCHCWSQSLQAQ